MRPSRTSHLARGGFTLIELLVVIGIIGLLLSLTMAAIMRLTGKGTEHEDRSDVTQMAMALNKLKAEKTPNYSPPSKLFLSNRYTDYDPVNNALHRESLTYLNKLFPRLDWTSGINWSGDPARPMPATSESRKAITMFRTRAGATGTLGSRPGFSMLSSLVLSPEIASNSLWRCRRVFRYCLFVSIS